VTTLDSANLTIVVERAIDGDAAAWNEIVRRLENLVWSVVRGFRLSDSDAHDATQMTWLRAVERLDSVRDPERVGLWLATIARRECMRIIEKGGRAVPADPHVAFVDLRSDDDPSDTVTNRSEAECIVVALKSLSADCQSLLRLVLADPPMNYADISELLGIAVGSIGPRRQRCLSRLRSAARQ